MKKIILILSLLYAGLYGFSFDDINHFVEKSKKYADNYKKKYEREKEHYNKKREVYAPEKSNYVKVLKNSSILKKQIFQKLQCDDVYSNQVVDTCYSYKYKGALAVAYAIDGELVNVGNIKERGRWHYNREIPKIYRSENSDYIRTGYDKGHCASDMMFDYSKRVLNNTYDLNINAVPMAAKVNRKTWLKSEKYSKRIAVDLKSVNVVDYMVYDKYPKRIGRNRIAVPKGFYKILYNKKKDFMRCFYYENDLDVNVYNDRLKDHIVDCRNIF